MAEHAAQLAKTQRVLISNPDSSYFGQAGEVMDLFPRSRTYIIRMDRTGAGIAFGWSEVVCAPSGNKRGQLNVRP